MSVKEHIQWLVANGNKRTDQINKAEVMSHVLAIQAEMQKPAFKADLALFEEMDDDHRLICLQGMLAITSLTIGGDQ